MHAKQPIKECLLHYQLSKPSQYIRRHPYSVLKSWSCYFSELYTTYMKKVLQCGIEPGTSCITGMHVHSPPINYAWWQVSGLSV